ncbi:MAG TPA: UDP-N-acetylmuramate dehydrogenase [Clostridiales bacterium]|nr:UDP-N-acetylmuramate dehydrogenase [Clostridiales bacterium]
MENLFLKKLIQILPEERIKLKEPMANHTSLHIGGEADYLALPVSTEEVCAVISLCKQEKMPYYIMGNGSNLLVSDLGYRGLILKLGEDFSNIQVSGDGTVRAQAGVLLSKLASVVADHSLTGFEFASGIPGTLGGAVTMNAGAYGGEMKHCLTAAKVLDEEGNILVLKAEELKLGYRHSILQEKGYVLLEADMQFTYGNPEEIRQKMRELNAQRREKQPLDKYSAGSTFKRPQGYFAGKLISDAGLRGYQVGGAAVSEKHCGFIINKENATAGEFLAVTRDVIRIVEEKYGVRLEPEVKFLGEF